jgi:hypothetical protein
MACEFGPNWVACGPPKTIPTWRHVGHCPLCGRGRRLVTRFDGIYYGTTTYCLACNGREQEGEWSPASAAYADLNREYITGLWDRGGTRKAFNAAVHAHERDYWESE